MVVYNNCKIFENGRKFRIIPSKYFRKWESPTCMYNKHFFLFKIIMITTNIRNILIADNKYTNNRIVVFMKCVNCNTVKYLPYES